MLQATNLKDAILKLAKQSQPYMTRGIVLSVDETNNTCVVEINDSTVATSKVSQVVRNGKPVKYLYDVVPTINQVLFGVFYPKYLTPAIDSIVLIGLVDEFTPYVIFSDRVSAFNILTGDKPEEAKDKIESNFNEDGITVKDNRTMFQVNDYGIYAINGIYYGFTTYNDAAQMEIGGNKMNLTVNKCGQIFIGKVKTSKVKTGTTSITSAVNSGTKPVGDITAVRFNEKNSKYISYASKLIQWFEMSKDIEKLGDVLEKGGNLPDIAGVKRVIPSYESIAGENPPEFLKKFYNSFYDAGPAQELIKKHIDQLIYDDNLDGGSIFTDRELSENYYCSFMNWLITDTSDSNTFILPVGLTAERKQRLLEYISGMHFALISEPYIDGKVEQIRRTLTPTFDITGRDKISKKTWESLFKFEYQSIPGVLSNSYTTEVFRPSIGNFDVYQCPSGLDSLPSNLEKVTVLNKKDIQKSISTGLFGINKPLNEKLIRTASKRISIDTSGKAQYKFKLSNIYPFKYMYAFRQMLEFTNFYVFQNYYIINDGIVNVDYGFSPVEVRIVPKPELFSKTKETKKLISTGNKQIDFNKYNYILWSLMYDALNDYVKNISPKVSVSALPFDQQTLSKEIDLLTTASITQSVESRFASTFELFKLGQNINKTLYTLAPEGYLKCVKVIRDYTKYLSEEGTQGDNAVQLYLRSINKATNELFSELDEVIKKSLNKQLRDSKKKTVTTLTITSDLHNESKDNIYEEEYISMNSILTKLLSEQVEINKSLQSQIDSIRDVLNSGIEVITPATPPVVLGKTTPAILKVTKISNTPLSQDVQSDVDSLFSKKQHDLSGNEISKLEDLNSPIYNCPENKPTE